MDLWTRDPLPAQAQGDSFASEVVTPLAASPERARFQQTLARAITFQGLGLHSGQLVTVRLSPAPIGHGLKFLRTDLHNGARLVVPSSAGVTHTQLCTMLSNGKGGDVRTVEHLMAALHATGLTNALIEIDGPEVPILDGSAAPFLEAILGAGLDKQAARQSYLRVRHPIEVTEGNKAVCLSPHADEDDSRLLIEFDIDFATQCIGRQGYDLDLSLARFSKQVSRARTFGFAEQIEALRGQGLVRGGSMHNAIVIENNQIKNPEGLRFADEFVRHKVLDAVGDLFMEGVPVIGRYQGTRAGHDMTHRALVKLLSDRNNFEYVQI